MIIYADKNFETRSDMPDCDWTGDALHVVADGTELALKILALHPYFNFILDADGNLIDVEAAERPPEPEPEPTGDELLNLILGVQGDE